MFIRWEELTVIASGNKLQLISPSKYNSLFSASILAITFSNSLNKLGGELGGRYQVPTRNGDNFENFILAKSGVLLSLSLLAILEAISTCLCLRTRL